MVDFVKRWSSAARWVVGAAGLALLVVAAIKITAASGDAGVVSLVIVGAVLLISPFVLDRVEGVSLSLTSVDLQFAHEISELGAPKAARILQSTLGNFAESYAFIHEELVGNPGFKSARVHLQDRLVDRSAAISSRQKFEATEVRRLFKNGPPMMRVLALGLMQGDHSLADGGTITEAILHYRSRNEQWQGLELARLSWDSLSRSERQEVHIAIRESEIPGTGYRRKLANAVLSLAVSPGDSD